jgi:hypothetical protein
MGEGRGVYRGLVGLPVGKRPLGRRRRRWSVILRWVYRNLSLGGLPGLSWLIKLSNKILTHEWFAVFLILFSR